MESRDILKQFGIRTTQARIKIFDVFAREDKSYSLPELESELIQEMDRATIYRNLLTMHESGILHQVKNANGVNTYILSKSKNEGNHAHFLCTKCGNMECLHSKMPNHPDLPNGYKLQKVSYLVEGLCNTCA